MAKCVIFCAGGFTELLAPIESGDLVIAADGGLNHTAALGITPDMILGDFDSLGYVPAGAGVYPVEKDDTDAMLAVRKGLALGFREFLLYGGLDGPRLDHAVANFQTLQFLTDRGARGYLAGIRELVTVISRETVTFPEGVKGNFSAFCMGTDAGGVTLKGLHYPLEQGTLTSGFPLGVSNHFTGAAASVTVESGSVLAIWEREAGLPIGRIPCRKL